MRKMIDVMSMGPDSMMTMQLLSMLCPKCKQPVQYVLSDDDRQFEADAEYWKRQAEYLSEKNNGLERSICFLEELLEKRGK